MSIEFVDPEPPPTPSARPAPRGSARAGRLLALVAAVAAGLTLVGVQVTFYAVVRTAAIVDFDGTTYRVSRIPVDAFGQATPVRVASVRGLALSDLTSTATVADGVRYGPWWLGLGVALLAAAVWAAVRPRSTAPASVVAVLGAILLGSLGAAWLSARSVSGASVPQIRFAASPAPGLWLLLVAAALALLAGLARATLPALRPRRRAHDVQETGPAAA